MTSEPVSLETLCADAITELGHVATGAAPGRYRTMIRRILRLTPRLDPEQVGAELWRAVTTGTMHAPHIRAARRIATLHATARLTERTTERTGP
jgi:hypothetical protein